MAGMGERHVKKFPGHDGVLPKLPPAEYCQLLDESDEGSPVGFYTAAGRLLAVMDQAAYFALKRGRELDSNTPTPSK